MVYIKLNPIALLSLFSGVGFALMCDVMSGVWDNYLGSNDIN
jgi:hypothetical protein